MRRASTQTGDANLEEAVRTPFASWPGGPFLVSTLPPSQSQRFLARALALLLFTAYLITLGFRHVQLARYEAFVAIANTIVGLNDFTTATLLFLQFSLTKHRALMILASGFLFKGLMMIPYTLAFPGVFAPDGVLGSMQTTPFLYIAQNLVFLLSAVAYTLLRNRRDEAPTSSYKAIVPIATATGAVVLSVLLVTWVFSAGAHVLPAVMADATRTTLGFQSFGSRLFVLEILISLIVFMRRSTSIIDLWLKVAVWTWLIETLLVMVIESRFSLVFYAARTMSTVSSCFVLAAFFFESLILHRRLVATLVAREQEREGHRTSIDIVIGTLAHELRQPLASILLNEQAGATMLIQKAGTTEEVVEVFTDIRASVARANEIVDSVRTMFAASAGDRGRVDVNALVRDAINLMRLELEMHHISVQLSLAPNPLMVVGHRGQLLEVLLNGLRNAIESLLEVAPGERHIQIDSVTLESRTTIEVQDTGVGIDPSARTRAFEPFFSTKRRGMGLGLSVCQSIISNHGGTLSLMPASPRGAVFRIELPAASSALAASAMSERAIK